MTSSAEYMRQWRASRGPGKTAPSDKATSRAGALAIKWVRRNHPAMWADFMVQARASLGLPTEVGPGGTFTKPIEHGTTGGYQQELYRGLPTCKACRAAWAAAARGRANREVAS